MSRCLILAVAVALSAHSAAASTPDEFGLRVRSSTAPPGGTAIVDILLESSFPKVSAIVFVLEYDASRLDLEGTTTLAGGSAAIRFATPPRFSHLTYELPEPGRLGISVFDPTASGQALPLGRIATIRFAVRPDATGAAVVRIATTPMPSASDREEHLLSTSAGALGTSSVTITSSIGQLAVSPSIVDFGSAPAGSELHRTLVISNVGSAPIVINRLEIGGDSGTFAIPTPPPLPSHLTPGSSLAIDIRFVSAEGGAFEGRLYIDYADATAATLLVPLRATTTPDGSFAYGTRLLVPAVARIAIDDGTRWRSTLSLYNGATVTAGARITLIPAGSGPHLQTLIELAPRSTRVLEDAIQELFGDVTTSGALLIETSSPLLTPRSAMLLVSTDGGTIGQSVPVVSWPALHHTGEEGLLIGIEQSAKRRTNLALLNLSKSPATLHLRLTGADGSVIGERDYSMAAGEVRQNLDFLEVLGVDAQSLTISITATTADATFFGYASTTDTATGAPIFQPSR